MARITLNPATDFLAGTRTFEAAVPLGVSDVSLFLRRSNWPVGMQKNIMHARLEWSPDNGATWIGICGITAAGGAPNNVDTAFGGGLPDSTNPLRRLRVELETFIPLRTTVDVEFF